MPLRWPYTDLACERRRANTKTCGVTYSQKNCGGFDCEELLVTSEEGAEQIGKPMGKYLTVNFQDPETLSDEEEQKLSCSIGIALAPNHGRGYDTLFRAADTALYRAKEAGKNRIALYSEE